MTEFTPKPIDELIKPLSDTCPTGQYERYTDIYRHIKESRREEIEDLPQGIWKTERKRADWGKVATLCQNCLCSQSKDLQIAVWYMESLYHLSGLEGLPYGFKLLEGLCKTFWQALHPPLEEDSFELRLSPFEWINMKFSDVLMFTKITQPFDSLILPYTLADFRDAQALESNVKRRKDGHTLLLRAEQDGRPVMAHFKESVLQTPASFYQKMLEDLQKALEPLLSLEKTLNELCPKENISFYRVQQVLDEIRMFAQKVLRERGAGVLQGELQEMKDNNGQKATKTRALASSKQDDVLSLSPIKSRIEAYAQLEQVADFLMYIEPHSPVPYLVKKAVSWGNLSLIELFSEVAANESDLSQFKKLLGIGEAKGPGNQKE